MMSNNPVLDEIRYQNALEAHQAMFPVCRECGRSLMNCDTIIRINREYICDYCADILTNDEMRETEGLD